MWEREDQKEQADAVIGGVTIPNVLPRMGKEQTPDRSLLVSRVHKMNVHDPVNYANAIRQVTEKDGEFAHCFVRSRTHDATSVYIRC